MDKVEIISDRYPDVSFLDGLDEAIVGVTHRGSESFVCYDPEKCIEILMERDGMDRDGAEEFFDYNIGCLDVCTFLERI